MKVGRYITVNGTKVATGFEVPHNETLYSILRFKAGYFVGHVGKFGLQLLFRREQFDTIIVDWGWHWKILAGKLWHITEKNTHDALHFLTNRDKSKPFFLNVAYFATHAVDGDSRQYMPQNTSMGMYKNVDIPIPVSSTQEAWEKMPYFFTDRKNEGRTRWKWRFDTPDKYQSMMKNYYRMASEVDTSVGIILNQLAQEGQLNNTLIIFTTDNGNFHSEHGLADKWYPHQESIRVPLIIVDPRMSDEYRGTVNDNFTLNIDLTATIVSAAGITPLSTMMGRDISQLYRKGGYDDIDEATFNNTQRMFPIPASDGNGIYHSGSKSSWRTEFFYEYPLHSNNIPASEALVRKDYKYFYWTHYNYEQLFDIVNDPGEMNDLVNSTDPSIQQKLKDMRKRFNELKSLVHSNASIIL
jgi:arylsulfatase A-like enzyme